MSENKPEWLTVGAEVVIYVGSRGYGNSYADCRPAKVERLTKTQVILEGGRRFRIADRREVGVDYYRSGELIASDDPRIAEAAETRRKVRLRSAALSAVDDWRRGAGGSPELARAAAAALLAYADGTEPKP